jgi:hypothetical protein
MFLMWFKIIEAAYDCCDTVAEWLRRWTANPMGSAREGSNPFGVALFRRTVCVFFTCEMKIVI